MAEDDLEVCPNCGRDGLLQDLTGWCGLCTVAHYPDYKICPCGALYKKNAHHSKCWDCRREDWLEQHADQIEQALQSGLGLDAAKRHVADTIRPTCHNCHEPIKGGRCGAKFCNKKPECEKASRDYHALQAAGLAPDVALSIATGNVAVLYS